MIFYTAYPVFPSGTDDPVNRALFVDFESLLPDQVLAFVDRLSMAHSVEVRPPFLDYRLMELAATLPGSMKVKGARVKHVLKDGGQLPVDVLRAHGVNLVSVGTVEGGVVDARFAPSTAKASAEPRI